MAIVHLDAFQDINTIHRQMNRLLDDLGFANAVQERGLSTFSPAVEWEEVEDALVLRLEVPGMKPEDLAVEVMAESVTVTGDRQPATQVNENGGKRSEFRYGKFQRVIPLPLRVQNAKAVAEYKDGILSLTLPKVEEEKNKVVKVVVR